MTRKLIAIGAAVALVLLAPTMVAAKKPTHASGTIVTWNEGSKEVVLKDSTGKEHIVAWNEKTVVTGTPKVGEHVSVTYTRDKGGKAWASEIHVGQPAATPKAPPKK